MLLARSASTAIESTAPIRQYQTGDRVVAKRCALQHFKWEPNDPCQKGQATGNCTQSGKHLECEECDPYKFLLHLFAPCSLFYGAEIDPSIVTAWQLLQGGTRRICAQSGQHYTVWRGRMNAR